jgi:hypothetical protein
MMILGFFGVGFMAYRRKQNGPESEVLTLIEPYLWVHPDER